VPPPVDDAKVFGVPCEEHLVIVSWVVSTCTMRLYVRSCCIWVHGRRPYRRGPCRRGPSLSGPFPCGARGGPFFVLIVLLVSERRMWFRYGR